MASQTTIAPLVELMEDILYGPALDWCVDATVPVLKAFANRGKFAAELNRRGRKAQGLDEG